MVKGKELIGKYPDFIVGIILACQGKCQCTPCTLIRKEIYKYLKQKNVVAEDEAIKTR